MAAFAVRHGDGNGSDARLHEKFSGWPEKIYIARADHRRLLGTGAITPDLIGLPALLAGTWLGVKLYGRLDEAAFRKVVLALLLLSGTFLVS
jgi:hypothetical protein